jgi:thioredoxin reductase (NADPH)
VDGAFIAVGHDPRSELVRDRVALDEHGHVRCFDHTTATSAPGVFACGDLVDGRYRQAVTAAGSGCAAALDAQAHLQGLEGPAAV